MKQNPVITTNALAIGYLLKGGRRKVVHEGLDLQLRAGEVTCLLGLNGAGKSTLLRTLCGFQPPLQGEIYLSGKALDSYSRASFAKEAHACRMASTSFPLVLGLSSTRVLAPNAPLVKVRVVVRMCA